MHLDYNEINLRIKWNVKKAADAPIVFLPTLSEVENPTPNGIKEEMEGGGGQGGFLRSDKLSRSDPSLAPIPSSHFELAGSAAAALVKNEMLNVTVLGLFHDHFGTGCPLEFSAVRHGPAQISPTRRNAGRLL